MINKDSLKGKTALITGAAGLLGVYHARALLDLGARVVLTDVDRVSIEMAQTSLEPSYDQSKVLGLYMDVTSHESVQNTHEFLKSQDHRVDILINNAAVNPSASAVADNEAQGRIENFSIEQWNRELSVGLTGAFICSKVFGEFMASELKGGVILNIASDLSVIAPNQKLYERDGVESEHQPVKPVTYSVVKTALVGLTRYLSTYWADAGVRANALSPGGVLTDQDNIFVDRIEKLIPLGRMASEDEYYGAIQFLCSDASAYMNGQNIVMDGGRSVW